MIADTTSGTPRRNWALWLQCGSTALVAAGAAYASYQHGKDFALRHGSDPVLASIWPLVVDGLLTSATVALWKTSYGDRDRGRWISWLLSSSGSPCRYAPTSPPPHR